MIRILYDSQMFDKQQYGGITRYFSNLILGLERNPAFKVKVSVLSTQNYYLGNIRKSVNKIFTGLFFSNLKRLSKWNKNYSRLSILQNDFDLFHPTYFHPYFLSILKRPFVITVHDMIYELYPQYFNKNDHTPQHKQQLIKAAKHIIAISETTKRDLMRILDVPADKITVVYHGHSAMKRSETPDISLPTQYLLFVGGREDYKNFEVFARGFAQLTDQYPDLKLICAGGGKFSQEEIDYLKQLGIMDRTLWYEVTDALLYWLYKDARAFIYPSLYEGFGLPILEAFESGCPVILSQTPSFNEVAGDAAVYFDAQNSDNIASQIQLLLEDNELRNALTLKGYARLELFSMDRCIEETMNVYRKCIES